jgi:hypothetical protein
MKFGSSSIDKVMLGSAEVSAVYAGSTKIYPAVAAYSAPLYTTSDIQLYYNPEDPESYSGSGATINDLSGNDYHGTLYNSPVYNSNAFTYNGTNTYLVTPDMVSSFNSTSHFTIEIWYKPTWTSPNQGGTVVSEMGTSTPNTSWHYAVIEHERAPFGGLAYDYAGIWTGSLTAVNPFVTANGWRQITLTYDGTNGRSYTNYSNTGVSPRTVALTRSMPWDSGVGYFLAMGAGDTSQQSGSGANYFKGDIGIVRVYNRALSGAEIKYNYDNTKGVYGL